MRKKTLWTHLRISVAAVTLASTLASESAFSQTIDYNLNQAKRTVASIASGLERLQQNDIHGFNRLSKKLNQAGELLQTSESKSHPEFASTVQQWSQLQQQMLQIATALQQAQSDQQRLLADKQAQQAAAARQQQQMQHAQQQRLITDERAKQAAITENKTQQRLDKLARQEEQNRINEKTLNEVLKPMMAKYNRELLPVLTDEPTHGQARTWAISMQQLRTDQSRKDLAKIDSLLANALTNEEDARQAKYWIGEGSQRTISEKIKEARMTAQSSITSVRNLAELISTVDPSDNNQAYRFAGPDKYENNQKLLDNALKAGSVVEVFNSIFETTDNDHTELLQKISTSRNKLDVLKPIADEHAIVLNNAQPARRPVNKDFLAPIAQEFWLNGGVAAESDNEGAIWISGNQVADITHNGEIWIGSNEMGSIEPNGDVWFDANLVGSLEPDGKVWRNGNQVGLIEQDGTAWINGSASGEITPFQGEWKRAAIIYYFPDFFVQ